jgi:Tol biopolymer transport system component
MPISREKSAKTRMSQRALYVACVVSVGIAAFALAFDLWVERDLTVRATGRVIVPRGGALAVVDVSTGAGRDIVTRQPNTSITAAAWSPDRSIVAYALFHRRAEDQVSSSEIYVIPSGGGEAIVVGPRERPGDVLDGPAWLPDGTGLLASFQSTAGRRPVTRIDRLELDGGRRSPLYDDAVQVAVGRDGSTLALVMERAGSTSLAVGNLRGEPPREIVGANRFKAISSPRIAPGGARVAFVAQGDLAAAAPPAADFLAWFAPAVAHAHGEPWRLWSVGMDGSEPRQIGSMQEDEPSIAWSTDGEALAVFGSGGLWLVRADGSGEPRRIADGGLGLIDWSE